MSRNFRFAFIALACVLHTRALDAQKNVPHGVPTPAAYLGFEPGADRKLADWTQVAGYMAELARNSPRVRVDTLGMTTLGRPFIMLTIAAPATLARLEHYRSIQEKLADPRRLASRVEAEQLIADGKAIVLITAAIHSTEVGAGQVPLRIAHRLATSDEPAVRDILENTIVLLIPSLNPDGSQLVVDWYRSTVGKPWEGAQPPFLYHHYAGHDNNRDWYAFTQRETQLTVEHAHNVWHPQIVHDIHQQGSRGSRFFLPPYLDPVEPNVDPLLVAGVNQLGMFMAWEMTREDKRGIVVNGIYDAWTPGRAYSHYHAGVRILSETASANMASPIDVAFDALQRGTNFNSREASWNFPAPWLGGTWRLKDIVDYQESGAFALLRHASTHRAEWLRSFLTVGKRAMNGWYAWPSAWVIPEPGPELRGTLVSERTRVDELLRILTIGGVDVARASRAFDAGGQHISAGSYVILMQQPYAAFAQTLLERQKYPDLRVYPGGPPRRPYDVTAHTLPLLFNVRAFPVRPFVDTAGLGLSRPISTPNVSRVANGLTRATPGAAPRIALYQSYAASMDEGWTRWIFDAYQIPFTTVRDADVRAGNLRARFDAIVLPAQSPGELESGRREGSVPGEMTGGLGAAGVDALKQFVRSGGTLIALEQSSRFAIEKFALPVREVVKGAGDGEFFIPGSILSLDLDPKHSLALGMDSSSIAWFGEESAAFETTGASATVVGRYGATPLLSGWAVGEQRIANKGALVEAHVDAGRVVLFGFKPQYRAQSIATFPLFFNALRGSVARDIQ